MRGIAGKLRWCMRWFGVSEYSLGRGFLLLCLLGPSLHPEPAQTAATATGGSSPALGSAVDRARQNLVTSAVHGGCSNIRTIIFLCSSNHCRVLVYKKWVV